MSDLLRNKWLKREDSKLALSSEVALEIAEDKNRKTFLPDGKARPLDIKDLFDNNAKWAKEIKERDPEFFDQLAKQQAPKFLFIGCADSRVPANEIVGLLPGELFVHRNVANVVTHTDFNALSVIQYAVEALKVEHIIVCGHYGCGGVKAAYENSKLGMIENWLQQVRDIYRRKRSEVDASECPVDRLCELNVLNQAHNVALTNIVKDAWARGQKLSIHAWIYSIKNGLIKDLGCNLSTSSQGFDGDF